MVTICETIEETLHHDDCEASCPCKSSHPQQKTYKDTYIAEEAYRVSMKIILNILGILVAIGACYMIINTDSRLYLIFWVCYSVLRRMMLKSRKHAKME